jgi:2-iminobutanoate/2-iminopropanoate deaminase
LILIWGLVLFSSATAGDRKPAAVAGAPPFSLALQAGNTLYLSGQINLVPETGKLVDGVESGTRQAMLNLKRELSAKKFLLSDVVATHVWLTDLTQMPEMNKAYRSFFQDSALPTRTTVGVSALAKGAAIEIAMVAVRGKKTYIYPEGVERGKAPFSPGILADGVLYVSGQAGVDSSSGKLIEGDFSAHVQQTLKNIDRILKTAHMDFGNVALAEVYMPDVNNFEALNKVYLPYTREPRPARIPVGVAALPLKSPVEITVIAHRKPGRSILPEGMAPSGNYSRGMLVDRRMYLAGVFSRQGDIRDQVKDCIGRMEKIVTAGGLNLKQVVEARVYLTDMNDYDAMNSAYRESFGESFPTRATVAVPQLPGNNRIGMTFVVAKSGR